MWKSWLVLVVKVAVWVAGVLFPSSRMVLQVDVKVTRTVFGVFFLMSWSESEEDEEVDDEEELANRAFFVAGFLEGGWMGLFLPNWSLSEKRSLVDRPIEMASVKGKISALC